MPANAGIQWINTKMYFVYILTNKRNGTIYIGITNNLKRRVFEHKNDLIDGFSKKYQTHLLAYYEYHENVEMAIIREKNLKEWKRLWKLKLIQEKNPDWIDLYSQLE